MKILAVIFALIIVVMQYKLWFDQGSVPEVMGLKQELDRQVSKNMQLRERNLALEAEVKNLKQGQKALEERARHDLGMIKDDEVFFQIIDTPKRVKR